MNLRHVCYINVTITIIMHQRVIDVYRMVTSNIRVPTALHFLIQGSFIVKVHKYSREQIG